MSICGVFIENLLEFADNTKYWIFVVNITVYFAFQVFHISSQEHAPLLYDLFKKHESLIY